MELLMLAAMVYSCPKALQKWIKVLQGNIFCTNTSLGLIEEQIYICIRYIQTFMEPAFKAIGEYIAACNLQDLQMKFAMIGLVVK